MLFLTSCNIKVLALLIKYLNLIMLCLQVGNLGAPVAEWTVGGTALTSLMDVERRHGILSFFSMFCTALLMTRHIHFLV